MKQLLFTLFLFSTLTPFTFGQERTSTPSKFGARVSTSYNFEVNQSNNLRLVHIAPVFSFSQNSHNIYIGPQFTQVLPILETSNITYQDDALGINFGYRYSSKNDWKNFKLFGQFNYSIFELKYVEQSLGLPDSQNRSEIIYENTVSIGTEYSVGKSFKVFAGTGFGSNNVFFLMLDEFVLSSFFGLEYRF